MKNLDVFFLGAILGTVATIGFMSYYLSQVDDKIEMLDGHVSFLIDELAKNTVMDIKQTEANCLIDMIQNRELFSDEHVQLYSDMCMQINSEVFGVNYTSDAP